MNNSHTVDISFANKSLRHVQSSRGLNQGPFYKDEMTVINEEEVLFPDTVLTLFDNTGILDYFIF